MRSTRPASAATSGTGRVRDLIDCPLPRWEGTLERLVEAATPVDADGNPVDLTIIQVQDEPEATDTNTEDAAGQDEASDEDDPTPQTEE